VAPPGLGRNQAPPKSCHRRFLRQALKYKHRFADPNLIAIRQQALFHRHVVHECAIPAVQSSSRNPLSLRRITQCRRDTKESSREIWLDGSRPSENSPLSAGRSCLRAGPPPLPVGGAGGTLSGWGSWFTGRVYQPPFQALPNIKVRSPNLIVRDSWTARAGSAVHPAPFQLSPLFSMQNGCRNRLVTFGTLLALLKCVRASRKTKEIPKERATQ